jgi:arylsulfatase A-like enzyme
MADSTGLRRARTRSEIHEPDGQRPVRRSPRSPRNRLLSLVCLALVAFAVAGCSRTASHEQNAPPTQVYNSEVTNDGHVTYESVSGPTGGAYQGTRSAQARFIEKADDADDNIAYGQFDIDVPAGADGTYGAAFYFPTGTFTATGQKATVDIVRWEGATDFGGIRIDPDHNAHLFTNTGTGIAYIGEPFKFQEGCWNWLLVNQKLSAKPASDPDHAVNRVFLNGRQVVDSHAPSMANEAENASALQFGIPYVDYATQDNQTYEFYVDNAYASDDELPTDPMGSNACKPPKPNILFIVTDDQRQDDTMHAMPLTRKWFKDGFVESGGEVVAGGTEFSEAFATTPLCCPSRASIFTGQFAHNHGVRNNDEPQNLSSASTLQHYLKEGDQYQTGIIGKYLNTWNLYKPPPDFDKWWITSPSFHGDSGYQAHFNSNGTTVQPPYSTSYMRARALDFIDYTESDDSKPWFLHLAPYAPHEEQFGTFPYPSMHDPALGLGETPPDPELVPSRQEGAVPFGLEDKPDWVQKWSDNRVIFTRNGSPDGGPLRDQQIRALRSVDAAVEAILTKLRTNNEDRDTLAFFISDNGYMWREHGGQSTESIDPSGCPSQGCGVTAKNRPYTESIKIPFFVRWPASPHVGRGVTDTTRYVANIDLAKTAADAATLSAPAAQMDGRSLLNPSQARSEMLTEAWQTGSGSGNWASLRGEYNGRRYHYIEYYELDGFTNLAQEADMFPYEQSGALTREYYDLESDPWEQQNLLRDGNPASPDAALITELRERLRKARLCESAECLPGEPPSSAVDDEPPNVWFSAPKSGAVVGSTVRLAADASDNIGVKSIKLYANGVLLNGPETSQPRTIPPIDAGWSTNPDVPPGTYTIRAVAEDVRGNESTTERTVRVERYNVQAPNAGEAGRIEAGDTITYSFNQQINPGVIVPDHPEWNGSTQEPVTVRISSDDSLDDNNDTLRIFRPGSLPVDSLGTVDLGRGEFGGWQMLDTPIELPATMVMSSNHRSLTVTIGTSSAFPAVKDPGTMIWTPRTDICSNAGSPCRITEGGFITSPPSGPIVPSQDKEF